MSDSLSKTIQNVFLKFVKEGNLEVFTFVNKNQTFFRLVCAHPLPKITKNLP